MHQKNLISSGALLHFLKKEQKFYKPVSEVTGGIGKTALIKRPRANAFSPLNTNICTFIGEKKESCY